MAGLESWAAEAKQGGPETRVKPLWSMPIGISISFLLYKVIIIMHIVIWFRRMYVFALSLCFRVSFSFYVRYVTLALTSVVIQPTINQLVQHLALAVTIRIILKFLLI